MNTMIQKFYALLTRIGMIRGQDKILHAVIGFIIAALFFNFSVSFDVLIYKYTLDCTPAFQGIIMGTLAGLGKEAFDEYKFRNGKHPKGADFFDLFWTMAGAWSAIFLFGGIIPAVIKLTMWIIYLF